MCVGNLFLAKVQMEYVSCACVAAVVGRAFFCTKAFRLPHFPLVDTLTAACSTVPFPIINWTHTHTHSDNRMGEEAEHRVPHSISIESDYSIDSVRAWADSSAVSRKLL